MQSLWSGRETANVGAAIPADVLVLDCDTEEARQELDVLHGVTGTVEVKTPKGYHFWFRWPRDQGPSRNTTNLFRLDSGPLRKVDTRGEGGYCVMPPSVVNNVPYAWAVSEPEYWTHDILPAPEWLIDACLSTQREDSKPVDVDAIFDGKLPSGNRNETLFKLACKLRAQDMPQVMAKAVLVQANQEACKPPLALYEVVKILRSAWKYNPTSSRYSALEPRKERGIFKKASEIESKPIEWLIEPYLAKGRTTLYAGPGGLGKSRSSLALAAHVSTGAGISHLPLIGKGPVVVLSAEDDASANLRPVLEAQGGNLDNIFIFETPPEGFVLDSDSLTMLSEGLAEIKPVLCIIDPIMSYLEKEVDVNHGNDVNTAMRGIVSLGEAYNCSMLVVHHTNKGGGVMGSSYFVNSVRSVLKLYADPMDPTYRFIAHHKANHSAKGPSIRFRLDGSKVFWDGVHPEWTDTKLSSFGYDPDAEETIRSLMNEIEKDLAGTSMIPQWRLEDIGKAMFVRRDWLRIAVARLGLVLYFKDNKAMYRR